MSKKEEFHEFYLPKVQLIYSYAEKSMDVKYTHTLIYQRYVQMYHFSFSLT